MFELCTHTRTHTHTHHTHMHTHTHSHTHTHTSLGQTSRAQTCTSGYTLVSVCNFAGVLSPGPAGMCTFEMSSL